MSEREREIAKQELRQEQQQNDRLMDEQLKPKAPTILGARTKADNSRFVFEDDDGEQEEINNNINNDIEAMIQDAADLKLMAKSQGLEITRQNEQLSRMATKVSKTPIINRLDYQHTNTYSHRPTIHRTKYGRTGDISIRSISSSRLCCVDRVAHFEFL